jgi:signal transduction histidine kinase
VLNSAGTASGVGFFERIAAKDAKRSIAQCSIAILVLAAITLASYRLHLNVATAGLLFVIVIVVLSRTGDFASSIIASIVAALGLAHLSPPAYSFRVNDPPDGVAIAVFFVTAFIISRLVSELRRMREEALSSVNRKLIDAEERERTRIARELHDDIGQRLALLAVKFKSLRTGGPSANTEDSTIEQLAENLIEVSNDIQALAHSLHSSKLELLGLVRTMRSLCNEFGKQYKMQINFRSQELGNALPPDVSLSLFRVLQEALHNSAKHSGTQQVEVELFQTAGAIHLIVRDSGQGFNPAEATKGSGLGLVSMQERIKLVKGELTIDSQPTRGTTIQARVPVNSASGSEQTAA